jgi:hypothetical protein
MAQVAALLPLLHGAGCQKYLVILPQTSIGLLEKNKHPYPPTHPWFSFKPYLVAAKVRLLALIIDQHALRTRHAC